MKGQRSQSSKLDRGYDVFRLDFRVPNDECPIHMTPEVPSQNLKDIINVSRNEETHPLRW